MSFQYFPLYTGDYLRDTRHLSPCEHGIYLLLLMHCWDQKGPAPLDERKMLGICNARSSDEIAALRRVIEEFFVRMDDGYYNKRMSAEVRKAEVITAQKRSAADKRWSNDAPHNARALHVDSTCNADAMHVEQTIDLDHRPYPKTTTTEADAAPAKPKRSRGSRLPAGFPTVHELEWCRTERPDLAPETVRDRFCDHWTAQSGNKGVKADWPATWRNWVRNEWRNGNGKQQQRRYSVVADAYAIIERDRAFAGGVGSEVAGADDGDIRQSVLVDVPGSGNVA